MSNENRDKSQDQIEQMLGSMNEQGNSPDSIPEEHSPASEHAKTTANKVKSGKSEQNQSQDFWGFLKNIFNKPQAKQTMKGANVRAHYQKLEERKILLRILTILLGIQMFFMNIVVLIIVVWCIFRHEVFQQINVDVLNGILDFTKYYVTAVLVELLGGVIFIVHSVFSEKISASDDK